MLFVVHMVYVENLLMYNDLYIHLNLVLIVYDDLILKNHMFVDYLFEYQDYYIMHQFDL
jgi:hypothetical protein